MKVILISKVANLGNIGDIANVRDGYAKNFLIPQKKAIFYSVANYKVFEAKKQQFEVENQKNLSGAELNQQKLNNKIITIIGNASDDGRLYGSITTATVAAKVNEILGLNNNAKGAVSRIDIILKKPIKDIGVHNIKVDLYSGVVANLKVVVGRSDSEAGILLANSEAEAAKQEADKQVDVESKIKKSEKLADAEQQSEVSQEVAAA
jgi:large subunit ribosomal protein L9